MTQPASALPSTVAPAGDPPPAPTQPAPQGQAPEPQPSNGATPTEEPLGQPGIKALQAERDARKELERKLADLSPLAELIQRIRAGDGVPDAQKTDVDRLTEQVEEAKKIATDERMLRLRLQVATEKGLTSAQAERLTGGTYEELTADADALLALFPQQPTQQPVQQPGTPRPDPTQGARGPVDLDAQIADAEARRDVRLSIQLKQQKALQNRQ